MPAGDILVAMVWSLRVASADPLSHAFPRHAFDGSVGKDLRWGRKGPLIPGAAATACDRRFGAALSSTLRALYAATFVGTWVHSAYGIRLHVIRSAQEQIHID
jgi:hypothetical protein